MMNFAFRMMDFAFKMTNFAFKMMDFAFKTMDFAFTMVDFAFKMMNFVLNMMDFALKMMKAAAISQVHPSATESRGEYLHMYAPSAAHRAGRRLGHSPCPNPLSSGDAVGSRLSSRSSKQ